MKRIAILGSTGSIGRQTLDVIKQHSDKLQVVSLTARTSGDLLKQQAAEFGVKHIALMSEQAGRQSGIPGGMSSVIDCATLPEVDIVVVSVAGVIGLEPTLAAIEADKDIALASKEVLVSAGGTVMERVKAKGLSLSPIDSEHSAIHQCLQGSQLEEVEKLFLTASGGPFYGRSRESLAEVKVEEALKHPTWAMGGKITIDSATLMNKGLEVIEAHWLFGAAADHIEVVVHPQSIIHSMVRFHDGSVLAQMGWPDMRLPIQYALLGPERAANPIRHWSPLDTPRLDFLPPDPGTFRCLALAYHAMREEGTLPCVLNAANEEAANAFLRGECRFLQIAEVVEEVMSRHSKTEPTLEAVYAADAWARSEALGLIRQQN